MKATLTYGPSEGVSSLKSFVSKSSSTSNNKEASRLKAILEDLKIQLRQRGAKGFIGLQRKFRIMDDNGDQALSYLEFKKAMKECALNLTDEVFVQCYTTTTKAYNTSALSQCIIRSQSHIHVCVYIHKNMHTYGIHKFIDIHTYIYIHCMHTYIHTGFANAVQVFRCGWQRVGRFQRVPLWLKGTYIHTYRGCKVLICNVLLCVYIGSDE